ncbi:MAG: cobalamin-dependent protein [Acidobacteria bacterium]|jgi:5-methyltetrahydrofolate--homocysteine methyltransferase|nr:cobalamin-dependent protein [Acidobacteriota bacterium]
MEGNQLAQKLADFNEDEVHKLIDKELSEGTDRLVLLESLREGMMLVSQRFEKGEYFLPELIMAGELFKEISAILRPIQGQKQAEAKGIIVFGTVHGDIHDIGKDVTIAVLEGVGFEVHDLGVNVMPEQFVKKIQETGAQILGLSGLITSAYDGMKAAIEAVTKAGLRDKVKIMIGGGIIDERVRVYTGADAYGNNPSDAVNICRKFIGEK